MDGRHLFAVPMALPGARFLFTDLADLNGDGKLDLAGVNGRSRQVGVLLGHGDGTFDEPLFFPAGTQPFSVVAGRFDADHIPDLAVSDLSSPHISLLLGNGDGSFRPETRFPIATAVSRHTVAVDLTGDGFTDLAVAQRSKSLSLLISRGDGTFEPFVELATDLRRGWRIIATDLDGDGFHDLVLGTKADFAFSILRGHGDGSFDLPRRIPTRAATIFVAAADFNGDGIQDVVHSDPIVRPSVAIQLISKDLTAGPEERFGSSGVAPFSLATGDFNLDGRSDIARAGLARSVTLFLSAGNGNFIVTDPLLIQTGGQMILRGDLNNDGRDDLVISSPLDAGTVLLNAASFPGVCQDADGDGYGSPGDPACPQGAAPDCDDTDHTRSPGTEELCDGVDNDCDDKIDEGFDLDHDDVKTCDGDCDDSNASIQPGASDVCDGLDNDCDGLVDENPDAAASCDDGFPCTADICSPEIGCVSTEVSCIDLPAREVLFRKNVLEVGFRVGQMTLGDLDGDGQDDLVAFRHRHQGPTLRAELTVLPGRREGFFGDPLALPVPRAPGTLELRDFNQDGALDLVGSTGDSLLLFPGRGDGTFQPALTSPAGLGSLSPAVADFDADGILDLALLNSRSLDLSILLGDGNGLFTLEDRFPVARPTSSPIAGEFTGDGMPDLVLTAGHSPTTLLLLANLGGGRFAPPLSTGDLPGEGGTQLRGADLNGDGRQDLVLATTDQIVTLLGTAGGIFSRVVTPASFGRHPLRVMVSHLDGDTHPDLAVVLEDRGAAIFLGGGDGSFRESGLVPMGTSPTVLLTTDLDKDGHTDLLTSNHHGDLSLIRGHGDGTFSSPPRLAVGERPGPLILADLNGDRLDDLVVANRGGFSPEGIPSDLSVFLGGRDGQFSPESRLPVGVRPTSITLADFNGDGIKDLAVTNEGLQHKDIKGDLSILMGRGDGTFDPQLRMEVAERPVLAAAGEFNGDSSQDLIVFDGSSSGSFFLLAGNGDGTFVSRFLGELWRFPRAVDSGDFNNDGREDLFVGEAGDGVHPAVHLLLGRGDGTFHRVHSIRAGRFIHAMRAVDLNSDGNLDLATTDSHGIAVILGQGDGTFSPPVVYPVQHSVEDISLADFNDDGRLDLAALSTIGRFSVLLGNGAGTFSPPLRFDAEAPTQRLATGDVDADGRPDVVVASEGLDMVTLLINQLNDPPVADAGPDQVVECSAPQGTPVQLDGSASSDPDGDPLSYFWHGPFLEGDGMTQGVSPQVSLNLGTRSISLEVSDGRHRSAPDTVQITVQDSTSPLLSLSLNPTAEKDKDDDNSESQRPAKDSGPEGRPRGKGLFQVELACTDLCDAEPEITTAFLNGIPVHAGQVVSLKQGRKTVVRHKEEEDRLEIRAPHFLLTGSCRDRSGHTVAGQFNLDLGRRGKKDKDDDDSH